MGASATARQSVWEAMLEAGYQRRYWHAKSTQLSGRERKIQIAVALLSSSAVLTALGDVGQTWVWKLLSFCTAVVAAVQPFLNYTRQSIQIRDVAAQWHALEVEYEAMWRVIDSSDFDELYFKRLRSSEVEVTKAANDLPAEDKKIQNAAYEQVLIARGVKQ